MEHGKMPPKQVKLLEGKFLAKEIREEIQAFVESIAAEGKDRPGLLALQAGDDLSSSWYIGQQKKWAEKLGIVFECMGPEDLPDQETLIKTLKYYRDDSQKYHGIFVAMPLPEGFNSDEVLFALDERKDVEGIHPTSLGLIVLRKAKLIPPTAYAAFKLIQSTGVVLRGKQAAIVGQSAIVGRPLQLLLGTERVTTIVCNSGTSEAVMKKYISESDIVIGCCGQPRMIKGEWIKPGSIVIDVGTTEIEGQLVGDVDFETASERADFITPVPGGVGPLTVTMLLQNLIHAYKWQKGIA